MASANAVMNSARSRQQIFWIIDAFVGILFLAPALLYILLLVGFPFLLAIAFSFSDVTVGNTELNIIGFRQLTWRFGKTIYSARFSATPSCSPWSHRSSS